MIRFGLIAALALAGYAAPARADAFPEEVTYCNNGGEAQKLDLYPARKAGPGKGLVVYIHGGGYTQGDKRNEFELRRAKLLTAFGFDVASINYRLAPQHIFPAQFEDALCALNWLTANGPGRGIDTSFIGLMGESAGGHMASLIGVLGDAGKAPKVGAVAAFYGAFDLVNMEPGTLLAEAIRHALPTKEMRTIWSPILYASADDPPFLLVHGKNDVFVSVAQSVKMALALNQAGHEPLMMAVENAGHGMYAKPKGSIPAPDQATVDKLFIGFFLKASGVTAR